MTRPGTPHAKTIFTLGHATHAFETVLGWLREAGVQILVDVRSVPRSKLSPQFNQSFLTSRLPAAGITYHHLKDLGARGRQSLRRSPNTGLGKPWQAYADYMQSEAFGASLRQVETLASIGRTALFCAEADYQRCHRRFIADALTVRGWTVSHWDAEGLRVPHTLPARLEIRQEKIIYPAAGEQLSLFF